MIRTLDLFSAAAGGWSLGLERAGFETVAACEVVPWRRALYAENFPHVRLYDDVRTLTGAQLAADLGALPDIVVGSPPCQDISSANTKGRGIDGEKSVLFWEAVRLIGECRPRWFALENSPRFRTRGADRILGALEGLGYACEPCVVGADDLGSCHERKRVWLIGFDPEQIADPDGFRRNAGGEGWGFGLHAPLPHDLEHPSRFGLQGGRARRHGPDGDGSAPAPSGARDAADAHEARQADGRMVAGLRPAEVADDGRGAKRRIDGAHAHDEGQSARASHAEMGGCAGPCCPPSEPWAEWNGGLAGHLRLDDGLSAWVAQSRVAVGGPKGTAAASLLVEAFGDAVLPQIPEAIGRAILRTEAALAALYGAAV